MVNLNTQSYNHIIPQSLIKDGWGTSSSSAEKSVAVLYRDRLEKYLIKSTSLARRSIIKEFKKNFFTVESNQGLVVKRNADSICGNRLIYNLTEEKFGNLQQDIELEIERKMIIALREGNASKLGIDKIYEWFSLQLARSMHTMGPIYYDFLRNEKITAITNNKDYFKFKNIYNIKIQNEYDDYLSFYKSNRYSAKIAKLNEKDEGFFLYIGQINTFSCAWFEEIFTKGRKSLQEKGLFLEDDDYEVIKKMYVSVVSRNKAIFLYDQSIPEKQLNRIFTAVGINWNSFQFTHEPHFLIVNYMETRSVNDLTDFVFHNDKTDIINNINKDNIYKDLIKLSDKYEKELKKNV